MSTPTEDLDTHGRAEDLILAALDDDAGYFSDIAGSVRVIAAHLPRKEIRQELRRILAALQGARETRIAGRAAYHQLKKG